MTNEFSRTFRVRWSETNGFGQVGLSDYLRYLMETAWDWGAANGLGIAESEALEIAWIIRETEIYLYRPLVYNDIFDFSIWLTNWRRVRGTRCFELRLKDGNEIIAQGAQQVVALNSQTLRPVRPPEHILNNFLTENPRLIENQKFPKLSDAFKTQFVTRREIEWRDLDTLNHVNNATYASFAEEAVGQALAAVGYSTDALKAVGLAVANQRFHVLYHSPAVWRDQLTISTNLVELNRLGGSWIIDMKRSVGDDTITQCVLDWSLIDLENGQSVSLPDSMYQALKLSQN